VDEELEEEVLVLRDRGEQGGELGLGQGFRPLLLGAVVGQRGGIRTPRIGFEVIRPSSSAVAKRVESDALVFLIIDVLRPSLRIAVRSSRTSLGPMSLSFQLFHRGSAWFAIVRRYSGRVVSEKPRCVRPA
jgi:hypothetical protein